MTIRFFFFVIISLSTTLSLHSQINESGDLLAKIGGLIDNLPSSNGDDYSKPNQAELMTWEVCLLNLLQKKYTESENLANQLDYDLIRFSDNVNQKTYFILQAQAMSDKYWGTYIFNPAACQSNLIIQAPHPRNDSNTGDQGVYVFRQIAALFYMVAGTHRCNSTFHSTCSGTTSTCNDGSEPYRESDMSHVINSIFQKTTSILLDKVPDPYFIQLHGFAKTNSDPYLILSNGTTQTPPIDYLSKLGDALVAIDPVLTYEVAHINPNIRLKGTTNTQGRLINESNNPCTIAASQNIGRFLHIEQEKSRLRQDANAWQKMADALAVTFRNLQLQTGNLFLKNLASQDSIFSANQIQANDSITLKAGKWIDLQDGFHAQKESLFLAKIEGCLAAIPLTKKLPVKTGDNKQASLNMRLAPNPTSGVISVQYTLEKTQWINLTLFDLNGRMVHTFFENEYQNAGNQFFTFQIGKNVKSGIYMLSFKSETGVISKRVILY